jgi:hypothetical protein
MQGRWQMADREGEGLLIQIEVSLCSYRVGVRDKFYFGRALPGLLQHAKAS